jgi:hypothetical protein
LRAAARTHARRVRALISLIRGGAAGHGVDPSKSALIPPGPLVSKINHRAHRGHRGSSSGPAGEARNQSASVSSVVNPSSAGHGVHPSNSKDATASMSATTIGVHLRSSAVQTSSPAGHGVHPSFRDRLRSSAAVC